MTRRGSFLEIAMIAGFVATATWVTARAYYERHAIPPEARAYREALGTPRYSFEDEELYIKDFFQGRRNGVFLDVGAGDYRKYSNTYFLEHELGWSGIAVDAVADFADDYRKFRPRTRFFAFFASDVSEAAETLWVPRQYPLMASSDRGHAQGDAARRRVPTIRLNDLLVRERIERLDFLNMDIELAEPKALAGFDIRKYWPELVCIEAHVAVRQAILDYFARNGYVVLGRYLRADVHNLYFTPLDSSRPGSDAPQETRRPQP